MKRKIKLNPELLNEELKKFKLLESYDFYHEAATEPEYEKPLLLSDLDEEENAEAPNDLEPAEDAEANAGESPEAGAEEIANELGLDEPTDDAMAEPEAGVEEPIEEPAPAIEEPVDDAIEVDVTSLVQGSEEAKQSADRASQNSEMLLQKLADLESRVASMDSINGKIESLEQEMIKRNPTPVEKLEMRSLSSFPYSQKLTDYWATKEGAYDVMNNKPEEYSLTNDDVDYDYSESEIKKSFNVNPTDYEEEDI